MSRWQERREQKQHDREARDARDEATIQQLREALRTGVEPIRKPKSQN